MVGNKTNIIAMCNDKGGVGKSFVSATLAESLSILGYSVLVIDTDPSGNCSRMLGINPKTENVPRLNTLLRNKIEDVQCHAGNFILNTRHENVYLIASNRDLEKVRTALSDDIALGRHAYKKIAKDIRSMKSFDFVIIDTTPVLGQVTTEILKISNYVIIPSTGETNSLEGAVITVNYVENFQEDNEELGLELMGILLNNIYDKEKGVELARTILLEEEETDRYGNMFFDSYVENSKVARRIDIEKQVRRVQNKTYEATDALAKEVLSKIGY